jgi:hypothetical protein
MALAKMRERQKLIVWITAILIIPVFAFTFGTGVGRGRGPNDYPLLEVDGETVYASEARQFLQRHSLIRGFRIGSWQEDRQLYRLGREYLDLQMAREAGLDVAAGEIGTVIRSRFERFADDQTGSFDMKGYREFLVNQYGLNPTQIRKGIEEALLLEKFRSVVGNTALVSPWDAYALWAEQEGVVSYDQVRVKTTDFMDEAREAVEDMDAAIEAYIAAHEGDARLREPGRWRLEYVLSPYSAWEDVPAPDEEKVELYYEEHAEEFGEKELDEVRDEIIEALKAEARKNEARWLIGEVDDVLAQLAGSEAPITTERLFEESMLLRGQRDKLGTLEAGATGTDLLTPAEIAEHEVIGGAPLLTSFLRRIDRMDAEARTTRLEDLRHSFNSPRPQGRGERVNFSNDVGVFKVRVLAYEAGGMRDPQADEAFRTELEQRILKREASELARERIEGLRESLAVGQRPEDLPVETREESLESLRRKRSPLASPERALNEPTRVQPSREGFEFLVPRAHTIPSYADFHNQSVETRQTYEDRAMRQVRAGYTFYGGQPIPTPGEREQMLSRRVQSKVRILAEFGDE